MTVSYSSEDPESHSAERAEVQNQSTSLICVNVRYWVTVFWSAVLTALLSCESYSV